MSDHGQPTEKAEQSSPRPSSLLQELMSRSLLPLPGSPILSDVAQHRNVTGQGGSPGPLLHNDASSTTRLPGIHSIFMSNDEASPRDTLGPRLNSPGRDASGAFTSALARDSPIAIDRRLEIGQQTSARVQQNTMVPRMPISAIREQIQMSPSASGEASRPLTGHPPLSIDAPLQPPLRYTVTPQPHARYGPYYQDHSTQPSTASNVPTATAAHAHSRKNSSSSGHSSTRPAVPVSQVSGSGHGEYYRYSDGTVVPVQVEGLPVKPHYGITKQGHPRKRGHAACKSCKAKKIKCVLTSSGDAPCKACAKTSSDCQWEHNTTDYCQGSERYSSPRPPSDERIRRRRRTPSDGPCDSGRQPFFANSSNGLNYKPVNYVMHTHPQNKRAKLEPRPPIETASALTSMQFGYRATRDPIHVNEVVTLELLDLYFAYQNGGCYQVISEAAFLEWVDQCTDKEETDLMIIYACMALGSIYTNDPKLKNAGTEAWQVAQHLEVKRAGQHDSQLALTRLHLALYSHVKDMPEKSFEYTSTACRCVAALRYNTEAGCAALADDVKSNEFRLEPRKVIEFRRRVFWLTYLAERYNGHCCGSSGLLPNCDIFVRVPSTADAYDRATTEVGPLFNQGDFEIHPTDTGVMAAFVAMSSLWGEVNKQIFYMANKAADDFYSARYEDFHADTIHRINAWNNALPENMRYSPSNTNSHLQAHDTFGAYFVLHSIHHAVLMKLNRHFHYRDLAVDSVKRKLHAAHAAAQQYLKLIAAVNKHNPEAENTDFKSALFQLFPGYTTLAASDILTRGGPLSALANANGSIIQAEKILHKPSRYIEPAKKARQLVIGRVQELGGWRMMLQNGPPIPERNVIAEDYWMPWKSKARIERIWVPKELDAIYGVEDHIWVDAIWGTS